MSELERNRRTAGQSRAKGSASGTRKSTSSARKSPGRSAKDSSLGGSGSSRSGRSSSRGKTSYGRSAYATRRGGGGWWMAVVILVLVVAVVSIVFAVRGKSAASGAADSEESSLTQETELEQEVTVENINITGMSREAAKQAIENAYPWSMTVTYGEESYSVPNLMEEKINVLLDEIYSGEPQASYSLDTSGLEDAVTAQAAAVAEKWDKEAKNGSIDGYDASSGKFTFKDGENGLAVDQEKLISDMNAAIAGKQFDAVLEVSAAEVAPEYDRAAAAEQYETVSTFTTNTTANSKRNTNIRLACEAINGTILQVGEEFSFNDVVGERTEAKGYQAAAAYNNGEVVQEIGGGVCQVSTTLYNAVVRGGFKITTRRSHTYEPSYVTPGQDATVSYGGPDFKFLNNSSAAIGLKASYSNQVVTISVYAIPILEDGVKYDLKSTKLKDIDPPAPTYEEDQTLQPGEEKVKSQGSLGSYWETRLVITKDGEVVSEEVDHNTTYKGHAPVILRNTSGVVITPEETTAPGETPVASEGAADGLTPSETIESSEASQPAPSETTAGAVSPSETTAPVEYGPGFTGPGSSETISGQAPGSGGPGSSTNPADSVVAPNPIGSQ